MLILQGAPDSIRLVCNTLITGSNPVRASKESSKDGSFFFVKWADIASERANLFCRFFGTSGRGRFQVAFILFFEEILEQ